MTTKHSEIKTIRVLVLGGGPAGSLAATLLARNGASVVLVEQHRFPRDKVCGECLSALGIEVLQRHGLLGPLQAIGRSLRQARLFGLYEQATLQLPSPMLGVSRGVMDESLLSAAIDNGAEVLQPARVEQVEAEADGVRVRVRDLRSNEVSSRTVDYVMVADGRGTWLNDRPAASGDLGVKAHFRDLRADPDAITLYGGIGCYGGVAPIENGRWNVAFSIPRQMVLAAKGDLDAVWQSIVARSWAITRDFEKGQQDSDWLAAPLPRHGVAKAWHPRVIPIGAAGCAIEPVGGEGMGTALRSAEIAVEALLADELYRLPTAYKLLWNQRSIFCRLGGAALADERWSDGVGLVRHPAIARTALKLMGK